MKYRVPRALSLLLLSPAPVHAANAQTVMAECAQIPVSLVQQVSSNSFFISVLFLQICLMELAYQLALKLVRRRARADCLSRIRRSSRECVPRSETTLYDHFRSRGFRSSNLYYTSQVQRMLEAGDRTGHQLNYETENSAHHQRTQQSGDQSNYQPSDYTKSELKYQSSNDESNYQPSSRSNNQSNYQPSHHSENQSFEQADDQLDFQLQSPFSIRQSGNSSHALADAVGCQLAFEHSANFFDANRLPSDSLFDNQDNELSGLSTPLPNLEVLEQQEIERLTFNAAYFASDRICDALFSKDVCGAVDLLKLYGRNPAVMSLVERKLSRAAINCSWHIDPCTGDGDLTLRNKQVILSFKASSDVVEAIVNKTEQGTTNQTRLTFDATGSGYTFNPTYTRIPSVMAPSHRVA